MKQRKKPIRRIVKLLNDPEEDGGFWLPDIQRRFVWNEDQDRRTGAIDPALVDREYDSDHVDEPQCAT